MTGHLSLVPMPEYSEPNAAPDELDPFDSLVLLCRTLHEMEVLAPAVGKCDPQDRRAIQPAITRAIESLQNLQTAPLSEVG
jgi:hypothetical protein